VDTKVDPGRGARPVSEPALRSALAGLGWVGIAGALGFLWGGATSFAQGSLPEEVVSFANSVSGWTVPTFLCVLVAGRWRTPRTPTVAALMGMAMFSLLLQGYAVVSTARGFPDSYGPGTFFFWAAVIGGPIIGVCAAWQRSEHPWQRALGLSVLVAILLGEGAYGLLFLLGTTSWVYWTGALVSGIAFWARG
jgi:Family of unknown function (DUF6518)